MPYYRAVGELPPTRHTLFRTAAGADCFEELIGEEGFSGAGSLLYHLGVPASLVDSRPWDLGDTSTEVNHPLSPRHFRLPDLFPVRSGPAGRDLVRHRRLVLGNADVRIGYVVADAPSPLYSNGMIFIEAPRSVAEIQRIAAEIDAPLVFNVVPAGHTPAIPDAELETLGYRLAIYPLALVHPAAVAMADALVGLGGEDPRIEAGPAGLFRAVGLDEWSTLGDRYR